MKIITITVDEQAISWAKAQAAERNMSLSRYVGELLRERMRRSREYEAAYKAWRDEKPMMLKGPDTRYPTREELNVGHV